MTALELQDRLQSPQPPTLLRVLPRVAHPDGTFTVDTAESVIRRTGRNLFNDHRGTVRLAGGEIRIRQGQLFSARFTIDMTSIANED